MKEPWYFFLPDLSVLPLCYVMAFSAGGSRLSVLIRQSSAGALGLSLPIFKSRVCSSETLPPVSLPLHRYSIFLSLLVPSPGNVRLPLSLLL